MKAYTVVADKHTAPEEWSQMTLPRWISQFDGVRPRVHMNVSKRVIRG